MIRANSVKEAWEIVNQIFPTAYGKDEAASQNAGYPVYRSTAEGRYYDYICDLNDRLEINLHDGNKSINVWIASEPDQEDVKEDAAAMRAVKELGKNISPLFEIETYKKITLAVDGSKWNPDETEKKVYNGLKREVRWLASDLMASYCDNHGIRWGTIERLDISHYNHGKNGENGGHFIITAYIGRRVEEQEKA